MADNGEVEVSRKGTVQLKQYHPVEVGVAIRLPIEAGETPQQAVDRVDGICQAEFDAKFLDVIEKGWTYGTPGPSR